MFSTLESHRLCPLSMWLPLKLLPKPKMSLDVLCFSVSTMINYSFTQQIFIPYWSSHSKWISECIFSPEVSTFIFLKIISVCYNMLSHIRTYTYTLPHIHAHPHIHTGLEMDRETKRIDSKSKFFCKFLICLLKVEFIVNKTYDTIEWEYSKST